MVIFSKQKSERIVETIRELFCEVKITIFFIEFHNPTELFGLSLFLFCFTLQTLYCKEPEGLQFDPLQFSPPPIEQRILKTGTTLYLLEDKELPLIQITALIKTGTLYDPPGKTGAAGLSATLLRIGGTQNHTSEEIDETLEKLGASLEFGMDVENGTASLSLLKKDLDVGLELFSEMLRSPQFEKKKFAIEKTKIIGSIYRRNDQPFSIAQREIRKLIYGPNHPLSRTFEIPTIKKISRKDLIEFHKKYYRPRNMRIAVSGDFNREEIAAKLEKILSPLENDPTLYPEVITVNPADAKTKQIGLAEKDLTQSSIILSQLGIKRHNTDRFSLEVLNEILGGAAFTSRLYKEVRSRQGLAYWIGSAFSEPWDYGTIGIGCQTKNSSVGKVIENIQKIIEDIIKNPIPNKELNGAKEAIINSFVFRYSSSHSMVTQKMILDYYGYPKDYLESYTEKISKVSAHDVQNAAQKYLRPQEMSILIVGNPKGFDFPLEQWGAVKKIDLTIHE